MREDLEKLIDALDLEEFPENSARLRENTEGFDEEVPQELVEAGVAWAQPGNEDSLLIELYKLGGVRISVQGKVLSREKEGNHETQYHD